MTQQTLSADSTREQFVEALQKNECRVRFTKTDGSERTLTGTLHPNITGANMTSSGSARQTNPSVVPVFDTDISEFRSFRIDAVKQFDIIKPIA